MRSVKPKLLFIVFGTASYKRQRTNQLKALVKSRLALFMTLHLQQTPSETLRALCLLHSSHKTLLFSLLSRYDCILFD